MPDPRTEVRVVFIPEIKLPDEDIHIPVVLDPEAGAAPSGTGLPSGFRGGLTAILGGAMAARIAGAMQSITAVVKVISAGGPYTIAAVAALAAAFAGVVVQVYAAVKAIQLLWSIGKTALRGLATLVKTLANAFINLATWAVQKSIDVLEDFVKSIRNVGNAVKTHIISFLKTAITTFADFEQSVANTVTVMGKFGAEGMAMRQKVGRAMKDLTIASRIMATEAAEAAYQIASAGFSKLQEVVDITSASIMLAEATLTGASDAAQTLMSTVLQFGLAADQATRVANVFAAAIGKSPALMDKLRQSLEYAGPIAAGLGIELEKVVATLMAMYKAGRTGARAGTELRIVFAALTGPTKRAIAALKEFGIVPDMLDPTRRSIVEIVRVFEQLSAEIGRGETVKVLRKAFSVRAWSGMVALLTIGSQELQQMENAITGTNTAFLMQKDQLKTLAGAWDILVSIWENVYYSVLEKGLAPALYDSLAILRSFVEEAEGSTGVFTQFGLALGKIVTAGGELLRRVWPYMLESLQQVTNILPYVGEAFAAAFLEVLPTAIKLIQELPNLLIHFFQAVIPLVLRFARDVLPQLLDFALKVIPRLIDLFSTLGEAVLDLVAKNGDLLIAWFGALLQIGQSLVGVLPELVSVVTELAPTFARLVVTLLQLVADVLPQLLPALKTLAYIFTNLGSAAVTVAIQAVYSFVNILYAALPLVLTLANQLLFLAGVFVKNLPAATLLAMKVLYVLNVVLGLIAAQFGGLDQAVANTIMWLDQNLVPALRAGLTALAQFFDIAKSGVYVLAQIPIALLAIVVLMAPVISGVIALTAAYAGLLQVIAWVVEGFGLMTGVNVDKTVKSLQAMRDAAWETTKVMANMPLALGKAAIVAPQIADVAARALEVGAGTARGVAGGLGPQGYGPQLTPAAGYYGAGRDYRAVVGPIYVNDVNQVGQIAQGVVDGTARRNGIGARLGAAATTGAAFLIPGMAPTVAAYRYLRR